MSSEFVMTITVEATYENGVLKPTEPLPLQEHERVRITLHTDVSRVRQTAGLLQWSGDPAILERFIMDPELDPQEGP
jgi:predicted DNA-binding antitoxin AbrB/MazE fold protein